MTRSGTEHAGGALARGAVAARPAIGRWACDLDSERLSWSAGVHELFGLPLGATPDRATTLQLYQPESRIRLDAARSAAIQAGGCFTLDTRIQTLDGEDRWMRVIADVDRRPGVRPRIHGVKQDITAERDGWKRLRDMPGYDPLTGVAGADLFHDRLHARPLGGPPATALILIEAQSARTVARDPARDVGVQETALRLIRAFPSPAILARIGGDRFAVLLRSPVTAPALEVALQRALMALRRPVPWNAGWITMNLSVGAAIADARFDPAGLMDQAQSALDDARDSSRGAYRMFGTASGPPAVPAAGGGDPIFIL